METEIVIDLESCPVNSEIESVKKWYTQWYRQIVDKISDVFHVRSS